MTKNKKTFVLVHGAWESGRCWDSIKVHLEKEGHRVFTPTLPGHGIDNKPSNEITFDSYIEILKPLLEIQEDHSVTLVGHGFSGMIISALAEIMPEKINKLVYLAAFLPKNGQSIMDIAKESWDKSISHFFTYMEEENIILLEKSDEMVDTLYNRCSRAFRQNILKALREDEPMSPFFEKAELSTDRFGKLPKCYIECRQDKIILLSEQRNMYQDQVQNKFSLQADHAPFYSYPEELTLALRSV